MQRYDIVSGILLILSIIDFALAAPVLVQDKRQACVDMVHVPRDAIAVLGKRGDEELEKVAEEYFKTSVKPVESSDAHASSSSAPLGPDHGSTNVVQAPPPNPALSTANPNPLMEPSSPSSPIVPESESSALSDSEDYGWLFEPEGDDNIHTATSSGHGLDHELSSVPTGPDHGSTNVVHDPAPNPASSTANPNPLMEPSSSESLPTASSALSDSENKWLFEPQGDHMFHFSQPNPNKRPWTDMNPDPDFDWDFWMAYVNRPRLGSASPKEVGQTSEYQAEHVQQPAPGPSTDSGFDLNYPPVPVSVVHPPSTSAELPTGPEHEGNPGSDKEPEYDVDPQAALYAAKGKAKELRRISGTTRDVGNTAHSACSEGVAA
ncbi:hypothetical protein V8E52_003109 [Russula decolorans]|jgi:hypothetical protein